MVCEAKWKNPTKNHSFSVLTIRARRVGKNEFEILFIIITSLYYVLTNHHLTERKGESLTFYIVIKLCFVPLDKNQLPINQKPQSNYYIKKYALALHSNWKNSHCYHIYGQHVSKKLSPPFSKCFCLPDIKAERPVNTAEIFPKKHRTI